MAKHVAELIPIPDNFPCGTHRRASSFGERSVGAKKARYNQQLMGSADFRPWADAIALLPNRISQAVRIL